jgi:hypothetical protein
MNIHHIHLPRPHVRRPQPARELALSIPAATAAFSVLLLLWSAVTGMSLSPLSWYIARASGIVLYLLTWFLVAGALGASTKLVVQTGERSLMLSLHRFAFDLWYGLLALHMLSIAIDPSVSFGLKELVLPFASGWREPWTGMGVLAAQVGLVVGASGTIRRLLGYRIWKAMHWLSLPMFAMALVHGLRAGTDADALPVFVMYVVTGGWVVFLATYRLLRRHARAERREERRRQSVLARVPVSRPPFEKP